MNFETVLIKKEEPQTILGPGNGWLLIILTLILFAVAVSVFGRATVPGEQVASPVTTPSPEVRQPRIYTVSYRAGVFSPTNLRIHSGDTVRFKNESFSSLRVVRDTQIGQPNMEGFDSIGDIPQGSFFVLTFSEPGVFGYHNFHNSTEAGSIIVR